MEEVPVQRPKNSLADQQSGVCLLEATGFFPLQMALFFEQSHQRSLCRWRVFLRKATGNLQVLGVPTSLTPWPEAKADLGDEHHHRGHAAG